MSITPSQCVVTFFSDKHARTRREERLPLGALSARIYNMSAAGKSKLPWLKFARFGDLRSDRKSLRHDANVLTITGIEADYDGGKVPFDAAVECLRNAGLCGVVYTSPSYSAAIPKWRVLCLFSRELAPDQRDRMMARLAGLFALIGVEFAGESWTLSQAYYYGAVNGNPAHQVRDIDGTPIDLRDDLDATAIGKPERPRLNGAGNRPITASRPEDITDKRIRGLIDKLLAGVRSAKDREKHHTLLRHATTLGGYLHLVGWTESEAVEQLLAALPEGVQDWALARRTAEDGLRKGVASPLELEDRPRAGNARTNGSEPPPSWEAARPPADVPNQAADQAAAPDDQDPRPTIVVLPGKRHVAADAGLTALAAAHVPFFQRDRAMVRIAYAKAKASNGDVLRVAAVTSVSVPTLTRKLGQVARWGKPVGKGKFATIDPPGAVVEQIATMTDEWPFPPLHGLITTQTLRPDGSVLDQPGYDDATGYFLFEPPAMPPIADHPTKRDALEALTLLNGLLDEFPFVENVDRSVAVSMLLTPVLRAAMPVVPMHVITAPEAGTGKSYLQDLASVIATGERCPVMAISDKADETEKRLVGAALAQFPIIALDNVNGLLLGDFLCQATERPMMRLRPLGTSNLTQIPNTFTIFANGNNLTIGADNVRRTIQCRLDASMETPEDRQFAIDPVKLVLADRGRYVHACLTIARAYIAAGMPGRKAPRASYEAWSDLVRSPLCWLGWDDPVETVATIRSEDPVRQARRDVFTAMADALTPTVGYRTAELIAEAQADAPGGGRLHPELHAALFAVAPARVGVGQIDPNKLGYWLRRNRGTIAAGYRLTIDLLGDLSRPRWKIEPAT